ncbi:hypothetical protein JB92DRAFT_3140041 [Gautieria morchelliformis]|nr:hypothetical protein JB92DRAFT_3140041 [Gautieria morchelliformis]
MAPLGIETPDPRPPPPGEFEVVDELCNHSSSFKDGQLPVAGPSVSTPSPLRFLDCVTVSPPRPHPRPNLPRPRPRPTPPRPSTTTHAHRTPHRLTRTDPQPQFTAHSESGAPPPTAKSWTSCAGMAPHAGMDIVGSKAENDMDSDNDYLLVLPNLTANPRRSTCRIAFRFNSFAPQVPGLRYCLASSSSPSPHVSSPPHPPPHRVPLPSPGRTHLHSPLTRTDPHPPPRPSTSTQEHRPPHRPTHTDP